MASIDVAASLLQATGGSVREVRISDLGEDAYAAEVHLDAPAGRRSVKTRLGDGLALAQRCGSRINIDDSVAARLALDLPADGSLHTPSLPPRPTPAYHPRPWHPTGSGSPTPAT